MKENIVGAVIELAFTTATYRSHMAHMHAEHAEKMEQHRLLWVLATWSTRVIWRI